MGCQESSQTGSEVGGSEPGQRRQAMAVFARATVAELELGLEQAGCTMTGEELRAPEVGLVMARGRMSGTGRPFNVGEVSVTRAAVRLAGGAEGFAYVLGRDKTRARLAALADAHWQDPGARALVERYVLGPVKQRLAETLQRRREEVAATQVDFFTMVRGED